jgi:hypothetical protein
LTLAVHWPGGSADQISELHQVVKDMTAGLDSVEACIALPDEILLPLVGRADAEAAARELRSLFAGDFEEIYYAHDVIGVFYAMLSQSYPEARRICFGDGLGIVYERHYHLSFLGVDTAKSEPASTPGKGSSWQRALRRLLGIARGVAGNSAQAASEAPFGLGSIPPHEAALILPVDQSGEFLRHVSLKVVPKELALQVLGDVSAQCAALSRHVDDLLHGRGSARKFLLMTENNAEGAFMTFERDVEMYCAIIEQHCAPGSVVYLKSHPGETLPRNEAIRACIGHKYELVEFDRRFKRYPIEFAARLVNECVPICMSYPVLSLKYLFDRDVIQPTDDAFIEQWYPEKYWASYKNALSLYMEPLMSLSSWDGTGLLWSGSHDRDAPALEVHA